MNRRLTIGLVAVAVAVLMLISVSAYAAMRNYTGDEGPLVAFAATNAPIATPEETETEEDAEYKAQAEAAMAKLKAELTAIYKEVMELTGTSGTEPIGYLDLLKEDIPISNDQKHSLWHFLYSDLFAEMLEKGDTMPGITFINDTTVGVIFCKADGSRDLVEVRWSETKWTR